MNKQEIWMRRWLKVGKLSIGNWMLMAQGRFRYDIFIELKGI
jgi:hypothetical protein